MCVFVSDEIACNVDCLQYCYTVFQPSTSTVNRTHGSGEYTSTQNCLAGQDLHALSHHRLEGVGTIAIGNCRIRNYVVLGCIIIPLLPCLLLLHDWRCRQLESANVKRRLGCFYCNYRSVLVATCFLLWACSKLGILHSGVMPRSMPLCTTFTIAQLPLASSSMTVGCDAHADVSAPHRFAPL